MTRQIHRIRGKNLREALTRAAEIVGENAVVYSSEESEDGQVTISVGRSQDDPGARMQRFGFSADSARRSSDAEFGNGLPLLSPALRDLRQRLRSYGASTRWASEIVSHVHDSGADGVHAIDAAAEFVGEQFRIAPSPKVDGGTRMLAFIGPTGAGKTTTLVKLAERIARRGHRVGLISLDSFRAGAAEQLEAFAERLEMPFLATRDPRRLGAFCANQGPLDLVLLDTTGRSPRDTEALADLRASLADYSADRGLASYLVQPASASRRALVLAHQAFRSLSPRALVLTKFDETDAPATALEYARTTRLPLAFLCDGQDVRRHLHRPSLDLLADLVLLGRSERMAVPARGALPAPESAAQRRQVGVRP